MLYLGLRPLMYVVRGASMEPSLFEGDVLLVTRLVRHLRRGDVVILCTTVDTGMRWQVKRVVGLPEDRVSH